MTKKVEIKDNPNNSIEIVSTKATITSVENDNKSRSTVTTSTPFRHIRSITPLPKRQSVRLQNMSKHSRSTRTSQASGVKTGNNP